MVLLDDRCIQQTSYQINKCHISACTKPIDTKQGNKVTYLEGLPSIKPYNPLIIWSCEFTQHIQNISPLPQCLCSPNLVGRWYTLKAIKLYNLLITQPSQITWQIKNFISQLPQCLKTAHLAACWLRKRSFQPQSHMVLWGHMKNQLYYISTFRGPNYTKLGKVVTERYRLPCLKSYDPLITWATCEPVTNWKNYISKFTRLITSKLARVVTSGK